MEATIGWTEKKPWEIACGELRGRDGSDERVDGEETVGKLRGEAAIRKRRQGGRKGNSLGRAPLGRSDTEATRGWTERKPWEIASGELRWEGAIRKRREGGRKGNRGK